MEAAHYKFSMATKASSLSDGAKPERSTISHLQEGMGFPVFIPLPNAIVLEDSSANQMTLQFGR